MKVYHGSYIEITEINLSKCKPFKDFGQGFYVTKYLKQAEYWAERMGYEHKTKGIITEFDFDEYAYETEDLQVLHFDGYNEAWLDFVVYNRDRKNKMHDYDIVEGPVADDAVTQRIFVYLAGEITKTDFIDELRFKHEPSHQIAFCTFQALQMLEKKNPQSESKMVNIDDTITQLLVAEQNMNEQQAVDFYFQSKTYSELIDESSQLYKKTWQEIYNLLKNELENIVK